MNEETKAQLEKYMQSNGFYDTKQIRIDEGASEANARFDDIFATMVSALSDSNVGQPTEYSELLSAAHAYNEALLDQRAAQEQEQKTQTVVTSLAIIDTPVPDHEQERLDIARDLRTAGFIVLHGGGTTYTLYHLEGHNTEDAMIADVPAMNEKVSMLYSRYVEICQQHFDAGVQIAKACMELERIGFAYMQDTSNGLVWNVEAARRFISGRQFLETYPTEEELAERGL